MDTLLALMRMLMNCVIWATPARYKKPPTLLSAAYTKVSPGSPTHQSHAGKTYAEQREERRLAQVALERSQEKS